MAGMSSRSRKLSINLSLFTSPETPAKSSVKSPKNFERPNGVVGLGILAAMDSSGGDEYCSQDSSFKKAAILAISPRSLSNPIPILSNRKLTTFSPKTDANAIDTKRRMSAEEMELCEEYTCVISHIGDNQTKKKEYFDNVGFLGSSTKAVIAGTDNINGHGYGNWVSSGVVSASFAEPVSHVGGTPPFPVADFLNSCFLCKKRLDGLDIFMYRGEKAFCSADCRCQQISIDEHKEKYVSGTIKPPLECSASPCSSPMQFFRRCCCSITHPTVPQKYIHEVNLFAILT